MAIIQCPECKREVSDRAISCPHCGFPIQQAAASQPVEAQSPVSPSPQPASPSAASQPAAPQQPKKGSVAATIAIVSLVIIALAGAAVWFLFFRGGNDDDERLAFENITRYEQESKLDSLEEALTEYLDTYNPDAHHYAQVNELNTKFSTERADWQASVRLASSEAIHNFLDQHPDGFFRDAANFKLDSLSFEEAKKVDTKEAYEHYIALFADGKFVKAAEDKISDLDHKELTAEESADVKRVISNHFDALANNDKVAISMTLAHKISSYIGKNDATEEDIYAYMTKTHASGRSIIFEVKNATVSKVAAGSKTVYNVQFSLEESIYSAPYNPAELADEELENQSPATVKNFTGTAVLNETMKITSLVLK